MAFFQRRPGKQGTQVKVYTWQNGKQVALPRVKIRHLDNLADDQIESWLADYHLRYENKKITPDHLLYQDSDLTSQGHAHRLSAHKQPSQVP